MINPHPHGSYIEQFEQRLALSVSLVGDLLLDALDVQDIPSEPLPLSQSIDDFAIEVDDGSDLAAPDLIEQAADLRQSQGLDGSGQTVAVVDSGIAWKHLALGGGFGPGYRVVGGWDFAEDDADPYDDGPAGYHGTHVAGLLAGQSNDFSGVAPGADLVGLRVFDDNGVGKLEWIESALQWVHDNRDSFASPITTVNLSVGTVLTAENQAAAQSMLADELQQLRDDQILVFAAAGNLFGSANGQGVLFPASDPSVVAVSSVDSSGQLSDFAQREPGILATRGESISSTVPEHVFGWDGDYDDLTSLDGTSMAAPQAAGASMLIRQSLIDQGIEPTAEAILSRLHESARTGVDTVTGESFDTIDLQHAVRIDDTADATTSQTSVTLDRFMGTDDAEHVQLDLRNGITLRVGEQSYELKQNSVGDPLLIDVGGGADSLEILGSEQAERLIVGPGDDFESQLTTNEYNIQLRGFEHVAFSGGGGPDRATMYDSIGDDTMKSSPGNANLSGVGFQFEVTDVPRVYVHATGGGSDTAFLHDSSGDDRLSVRPQFTSLRGEDSFQLAYGFERVYAYAGAGGNDSAEIYDSAGDDTMSVSASRSMISGEDYHVSAKGFASVVGYSSAGGNDIARLYADELSTRWHVTADLVEWTGSDDATRVARGFDRVEAFEQYQPIDLTLHAISQQIPWAADEEREGTEAEALRAIFDAIGGN